MYTLPLSDQEYQALTELKRQLKYGDNQGSWKGTHTEVALFPDLETDPTAYRTAAGWVLLDEDGEVRGWHWIDPFDPQWNDEASAARSFVPETRRWRWLTLLGYRLERDDTGRYLAVLLRAASSAGR
ncbi:hypothetical protein [Mycobacteroides abscessus]|uniref:hypothetical protein n=1 Tax=Mycobacteroides abscessus TaxID=36809 RepID=UPI0003854CBE|nr:hypothetical protein [Mycobacteroides abscessus]EPZ18802.1 hypothetical protein M879_19545 [Mycobacteroides abscessus V06705]MDO3267827.1 hypothetical protein [Mycobacteroides abscessus subsp. abscessus]SLF48134.1 Uncharacterised protein [Mycobacteroides abscessus subsp. abscessus]